MSILGALFGGEKSETEREVEEFTARRKREREVFDAALREWLLLSGLGPIMLKQTEDYARKAGLDGWPEQFDRFRREFDPRNPQHVEILDYIREQPAARRVYCPRCSGDGRVPGSDLPGEECPECHGKGYVMTDAGYE